jgi:hypothetical protein
MSQNFIDEYLIRLGAAVDSAGITRFQNSLRDVTAFVDNRATAMTGSFLKAQTEIVGGFAAIGVAALGLVDKVAMADQEYRLFAMRMYMTKDAARSLKVAMDTLGQPLENLAWDPELRARTQQLVMDQRHMAAGMGPDFEQQMRKIRDVRFEFQRMEVELQYLGMSVVSNFMKSLGVGPDDLLAKLRKFNEWIINDMPQLSQKLATNFMPIWQDIKVVIGATADSVKELGVIFQNLVGLFTGDTSLAGTEVTLEKLATATHHVADGFAHAALLIAHTEQLLAHLLNAALLVAQGQFKSAWGEVKAAGSSISTQEGMEIMGGAFGMAFGGPLGAMAGAGAAHQFGAALGGPSIRDMLSDAAAQHGLDFNFLSSLAQAESGQRQFDENGNVITSSTGARGVMQLLRSTAGRLGVNPDDAQQNIFGGAALLKQLLDHYGGNLAYAVGGYHEGQGKMDAILSGKASLSPEAQGEIARVLGLMGKSGDVNVGGITIHIAQTNATAKDIQAATTRGVVDGMRQKEAQRNLVQTQGTYGWSG